MVTVKVCFCHIQQSDDTLKRFSLWPHARPNKKRGKKEGVEPPVIQGPLRCRACVMCNRVSVELCGSAPCQALLLRGPRGAAPV